MGAFLSPSDLTVLAPGLSEAMAKLMIEDVEALAVEVAPCILDPDFPSKSSVKAILRQALLRWERAGEGGVTSTQQASGPFSRTVTVDSRVNGEGRLYPSEVARLQAMCRQWKGSASRRRAFTVMPGRGPQ